MRILLLNQVFYPDPVATAQYLTDMAVFLQGKGYQVTVIAGQRDYERRSIRYPLRDSYQGIEIRRIPSTGFGKSSFFRRLLDSCTFDLYLLGVLATLPKQDVVITFTSPPMIGVVGAMYCAVRGGKCVQWLMDLNPDIAIQMGYLKTDSWVTRMLNFVFERSLKNSFRIVVLDRWMKDRVVRHGAEAERIAVVPPWTVLESAAAQNEPRQEDNPFRRQHGLVGKFVVLYSGNHSIVHPLDSLLEAARRLNGDDGVKFVFVGGGLRVKDVTEAVKKYGLKNVLQLPHQPREMLPYSLSSADLPISVMGNEVNGLVHTSKIYAILSTGRPYLAIGPKASHLGDLVTEATFGYQVEHGDIDGILSVIREVRGLGAERKQEIAELNRAYVQAHNTAEKCLTRLIGEVLNPAREDGMLADSIRKPV